MTSSFYVYLRKYHDKLACRPPLKAVNQTHRRKTGHRGELGHLYQQNGKVVFAGHDKLTCNNLKGNYGAKLGH